MGETLSITAADGHNFKGYLAVPEDSRGPSVLILQEVFDVNRHIRAVCDRFAEEDYFALAPKARKNSSTKSCRPTNGYRDGNGRVTQVSLGVETVTSNRRQFLAPAAADQRRGEYDHGWSARDAAS
jgi:dienelactone hydrolase